MLDDERHYVESTVMVRSQHTNEPTDSAASPATRLRFDRDWTAVRRLIDGTRTRLRLLRDDNRDALFRVFEQLSSESRYRRFFTAMPRLRENFLERLLHVDGWNHVAVVAEVAIHCPEPEEPFGVARFVRLSETPDTAEAAIAVVDHMQNRGLGKVLLSALAAAARERGITKFRAEVLRGNEPMKALLRDVIDESLQPVSAEGGVVVYEVPLADVAGPEIMSGPLFRFLKVAAGIQALVVAVGS